MDRVSCTLWSVMSTPIFFVFNFATMLWISSTAIGSTPAKGSSSRMNFGSVASVRAISAELIREKLFRLLGQELPYSTAVEIETFEEKPALTRIRAVILVDKPGQKAIVIGKGGVKLKEIGSAARADIEKLVGGKVFLELWVKVKQSWADDRRTLDRLGLS